MSDTIEKHGEQSAAATPDAGSIPVITIMSPATAPEQDEIKSGAAEPLSPIAPDFPIHSRQSAPTRRWFSLRRKRLALLAATALFAAGIGAFAGTRAVTPPEAPAPQRDMAAVEEREAMQKTIARLTKDIIALRAGLDTTSRNATAQLAKMADRVDRAERTAASANETTGSIAKQIEKQQQAESKAEAAPTPAVPTTVAAASAVPIPAPKPVQSRPPVLEGWTVRDLRDGTVLVENRGDVFEAFPGAPLPGLGRIEAVRRSPEGRPVVVTPRGVIVTASRARGGYAPY